MRIFWRIVSQSLIGLWLMIFAFSAMAQDMPSEHQARVSELAAAAAVQKYTDTNGFTHWHSEINSGCRFSDHNYTLDIDVEPDHMSDISYTMSNYDVDYNDPQSCSGGPEVDRMYFNGHSLGILTGANNSWSVNNFPLADSQVVKGSNQIYIDTDAPGTGCWCVGVGYIEVTAKVGFDVISHSPGVNEKNRDFKVHSLGIEVTFSDDYDPATLTDSTFKLEYRNAAGAWQQVAGTFQQSGPKSFKFLPDTDLKDSVKYRATVKSGSNGVKSLAGTELQSDKQWSFWTIPDLGVTDSFGGSACAPSAAPCKGLEVAVFQTARNAPLVNGKAAVARIYPRWKKHSDVHDDDQVKEMEADFELTGGGITQNLHATVKRPDIYSAADKKAAKESVNVYHTPVSNAKYTVKATPTPQSNSVPVSFKSNELSLAKTNRAPTISFKHYYLKDGAWDAGAPAAAKTSGRNLMNAGAVFITDTFPVLATAASTLGDLDIGYTDTGTVDNTDAVCGTAKKVNCPVGGTTTQMKERHCIYKALHQKRGTDKFTAATVPSAICPGNNGIQSGGVFLYFYGAKANYGTIAHEVGHVYGISTANNPNQGHRNSNTGIEGFQVRRKRNRSVTADSSIKSLMHRVGQPAEERWIHNDDYATLHGTVAGGVTAVSVALPQSLASRGSPAFLIVGGVIDPTGESTVLEPAYVQEFAKDEPVPGGSCRVDLLNASGTVVASAEFNPFVELEPSFMGTPPGEANPSDPQIFSVSVPWNDNAAELELYCNGTLLTSRLRTQEAPSVAFVGLSEGDQVSGEVDIVWQGSDFDGPQVLYRLEFSPDGGSNWSPLSLFKPDTHFLLDTRFLPSMKDALFSVMATDGFNTTYATISVEIGNPLAIQGTIPFDGETDVDVNTPIAVYFVSALDEATLTSSTFRVSAGGQAVAGTLSYNPISKTATFTPNAPLAHSTMHQVQLTAAIQDELGNSLVPTTWTFTTAADIGPPTVTAIFPAQGAVDVPLNALVQIELSEPAATGTLGTSSLRLLDDQGAQVPGQVFSFVDNTGAIFIADQILVTNMEYTVVVTTGVTDVAGNPLDSEFQSAFTTGDRTFNVLRIVGDYRDTPSDDNGDGLYDKLTISVLVEVAQAGSFNLNGRLLTSDRDLIQWATSGNQYLDVGIHWVDMVFDGVPIRNTGMNGSYILDSLNFYVASNPSVRDVVFNAFRTYPYDVTLFYSVMTLGPLPDQRLEIDTIKDNAINLRDYTTHTTLPLDDISYSLLVGAVPEAGVSIDGDGNIDIVPQPGTESESDVTVQATDTQGNRVQTSFHVGVQSPAPAQLVLQYAKDMPVNTDQTIEVDIFDQFGRRFEDLATVVFETTLGSLWPDSVETISGMASATFSSDTQPGYAFLTVSAGGAETVVMIEITEDIDADGDGVPNADDECPNTLAGEIVDGKGCSIVQLCPCGDLWKNHGEYVSCVTHSANEFRNNGLLSGKEKGEIVSAVAASECGKKK